MSLGLRALRGLRSAPVVEAPERAGLLEELQPCLAACDWFTVGVMAPSAEAAVCCLRQLEAALGWSTLEFDPGGEALEGLAVLVDGALDVVQVHALILAKWSYSRARAASMAAAST